MPTKTKGLPFHFGKSMFADDTAYLLLSRDDLQELCPTILHHMHRFGLLMHVSSLDENGNHLTESKTKAMYFPAHPLTKEQLDAATADIVLRPLPVLRLLH